MAKSENQGLQIAVILLALLTIVLSITTFYFFNKWTNTEKEAQAAAAETEKSRGYVKDAEADLVALLTAVNGSPQGDLDKAVESADLAMKADLARWQKAPDVQEGGFALPADVTSYQGALNAALDQIKNIKAAEASVRANVKTQTTRELQPIQPNLEAAFTAKNTEHQAAANTFFTRKADNETKIKQAYADNNDKARQIRDRAQELMAVSKQQAATIQQEERKLAEVQAADAVVAELLSKLIRKDFDGADGAIVRVDDTRRLVWINLGHADNLRPQIQFRVYAMTPNGIYKTQEKAEVEVLRILGDHLSECRITRDHFTRGSTTIDELTGRTEEDMFRYLLTDPIQPGDVISTPLWNPGDEVRYVLAGVLDIDGDGQDDRSLIKTLLAASGGLIDGEVTGDGTSSGAPTVRTRYVVIGSGEGDAKAAVDAMVAKSRSLGVEPLTLEKLLDKLGASRVDPKEINKAKDRANNPQAAPVDKFRRQPPPGAAPPAAPANQ